MSYPEELRVALEAACAAGAVLQRHYAAEPHHWEKSKDDPVTHADLESDRTIHAVLEAAFPADAILSEETVSDLSRTAKPRVWIVDPMDGTKEFTKRIPEFGVSIALTERGEPVAGAILNPAAGVAVFAARGAGAFRARWDSGAAQTPARAAAALQRGAERVRVSGCASLADAVVIASRTEISRYRFAPYRGWFKELRPVGSIAWKLACIACGEGDLNVSLAPKNEWDVCAGDLLVREAGGVYLAFDGARRRYNQADTLIEAGMAAGPPGLVAAFCERERQRARG